MQDFINKLNELAAQYNEVLAGEVVDQRRLTAIEEEAKGVTREAKKLAKLAVYGTLEKTDNPAYYAAEQFSFQHPGYRLNAEKGVVTEMQVVTKVAIIDPIDFTEHIRKLSANSVSGAHFQRTGIVANGHAWNYELEQLGLVLAYRVLKDLNGSAEALQALQNNYFIRDIARKEARGETPTSNRQTLEIIQEIIDKFVWIDNGAGGNRMKANRWDIVFLENCFTAHGKGVGSLKVLKGRKLAQYLFEVCHMMATGKAYSVEYKTMREGQPAARKAIKPDNAAPAEEKPAPAKKPRKGKKAVNADAPVILTSAEESTNDTPAA